jgi:hypothetical protein
MSFTFPLILGGLLLAGVPVLIHFLMRHKPRSLPFPALRFLLKRHRSNVTRLRLRHLVLLLLRIGLIALICFALAQPRVQDNPWSLPTDQPVAAVFVFDTSASMDYTIPGNQTRLKEAQKRALELLKMLPEGSEVVLLDTYRPPPEAQTEWLSRTQAAEQIGRLKLEPANAAVTARLENALKILGKLSGQKDKDERWKRPRLLCVFSDRTQASWETKATRSLQALVDQVPPTYARLAALQAELAGLIKILPELRERLPLLKEFADQDLKDSLEKLRTRLTEVRADDYPDEATTTPIVTVRPRLRELLTVLPADSDKLPQAARDYRAKLVAGVRAVLRNSAGFTALYFDVGIDQPTDLAVVDLELVRKVPAYPPDPSNPDDTEIKIQLRSKLQATGQEFQPTIVTSVLNKSDECACKINPGDRPFVFFNLPDALLDPGFYQAKVLAKPTDHLPINNTRYLTYAVRRILLVTDKDSAVAAERWKIAIEAHRFGAVLFRCDVKGPAHVADIGPGGLDDYHAIFLCSLDNPDERLWSPLKNYVDNGGGLGVLPPLNEMNVKAYNDSALASEILPAKLEQVLKVSGSGAEWNWSEAKYQHPMMHPYQEWRQGSSDIGRVPRGAKLYWQLSAKLLGKSAVLVSYDDGKNSPALVERVVDLKKGRPGRVLLFTTPPGWPEWNDYADNRHSFFVALAGRAVGYLTGDADRQALNFVSSRLGPRVPVPVKTQVQTYNLHRDVFGQGSGRIAVVTVEAGQNETQVAQAVEPGNYTLRLEDDGTAIAWFSVNLPAEESDLTRVDKEAIEAVLGPDAVLPVEARTDLQEAMQGHISKPLELLPYFMIALLFVLALENLLANKFYRREPETAP